MKIRHTTLTCAAVLLTGVCANAISLDLLPSSSSVTLGTPVNMELRISGLGEATAPSLGGYSLTLGFDPAILGVSSFTFGSQLSLGGSGSIKDLDGSFPGEFFVVEFSLEDPSDLDALQASAFSLGTISFSTLGVGTSSLQFSSAASFVDSLGEKLVVALGGGAIEVTSAGTAVPDAGSTALLLALGLVACGIKCRKP